MDSLIVYMNVSNLSFLFHNNNKYRIAILDEYVNKSGMEPVNKTSSHSIEGNPKIQLNPIFIDKILILVLVLS